ncbi:MAG: hypothetical protein EP332_03230 [Bacteroidetes bacterium]|nr:MAG: hypothetical protein EP332_03230 [Bacteroidota bacterium]
MKNIILVFALALFLVQCKKDNSPVSDPAPESPSAYHPMKTGNYWIYQWYKVDMQGNAIDQNFSDSVYIAGDTLINGEKYWVRRGKYFGSSYEYATHWRDSASYLVDEFGRIQFSNTNFTDTLFSAILGNNQIYQWQMMVKDDKNTEVPAGSFATFNYQTTLQDLHKPLPCGGYTKKSDKQFAKGVGIVRHTFSYMSDPACTVYEARLVRYKLN